MVPYGADSFGMCDVVPGLFYIQTQFFHVCFVPLIPLQTQLVIRKPGIGTCIYQIPFCIKSILFAWIRTASFFGICIAAWNTADAWFDQHSATRAELFAAITIFSTTCFAYFMIYPRKKLPGYARACHLAQLAKLD